MSSETQMRPRPFPPGDAWPPDDTEQSVLGTDLHQTTITNLRWGINEVAHLRRAPGQPLPWQALSQIALLGCERPDGSAYRTFPDVFVYPHPIDPGRGSLTLAVDGPPVLIIEVLSESTYEADIDLVRGKGYSYARAGVREYLALDPTEAFLPERGRGWRLVDGVYRLWEPDAAARWQSEQIAVAIGLEGMLATVYTREGERQLREGEVAQERAHDRAELERLRAELKRLRDRLDERQGER
jgi:Putative restriction endonuclease